MSNLLALVKAYENHARLANEARSKILEVLGAAGLPSTLLAPPASSPPPPRRELPGSVRAKVLTYLQEHPGPITAQELARAIHAPFGGVRDALTRSHLTRDLRRVSRGVYEYAGPARPRPAPPAAPPVKRSAPPGEGTLAARVVEYLKQHKGAHRSLEVARAVGGSRKITSDALNHARMTGKAIRVSRGTYRWSGVDVAPKPAGRPKQLPEGGVGYLGGPNASPLRDVIAKLASRHPFLDADIVALETGMLRTRAVMALSEYSRASKAGHPPILVRVGVGRYAPVKSNAALGAALRQAIAKDEPKPWRPKKAAEGAESSLEPQKNSEPHTPQG